MHILSELLHLFFHSLPQLPPFIVGIIADRLAKTISENAINVLLIGTCLPEATRFFSPKATAQYHSIYMTRLLPSNSPGHTHLVAFTFSVLPAQRRRVNVWVQ